MAYFKLFAAILLAGLLSACGGGGSDSPPPTPTPPAPQPPPNAAPSAVAPDDFSASSNDTVTLDGSQSSDDTAIVSFLWEQTDGQLVQLTNADSAVASFEAPNVAADSSITLSFRLTVTDGANASDSDIVIVTIEGPVSPPPVTGEITLSGIITYDHVPHSGNSALDYDNTTQDPVRGATIELLQGDDLVRTSRTDDSGAYAFDNVSVPATYTVRVRAQLNQADMLPSWNVRIVDNTNEQALYTMQAEIEASTTHNRLTLNASSGWTGNAYTRPRVAGPFAILDSVYQAMQTIVAVDNTVNFPALNINWSVNNVAVDGDESTGQIGTSFFNGTEIFLLGAADSDSDEYDGHVVVHEWGHYFEGRLSRADSIGGSHSNSALLDMRVALGEGFGNAIAGIVTNDPIYRDSFGARQAAGFSVNVESSNSNRGFYSSASTQAIIYDLYDSNQDTSEDTLALGFAPIYEVLVGPQVTTPAFTSIYSLTANLKAQLPERAAEIDALLASFDIVANDIYGTGETNDGGDSRNLPVHKLLTLDGGSTEICSFSDNGTYNRLGNNQYLRFTLPSEQSYRIDAVAQTTGDVDIIVYRQGVFQLISQATGNESTTQSLPAGDYVMEAYHFGNRSGDEPADLCFDISISTN